MAGFTKGPWELDGISISGSCTRGGDVCLMGEPAQWSGDTPRMLDNYKANANLIAAAPDLYEALEAILNAGVFYHSAIEIDTYAPNYKDGEQLEAQARAAMSKAIGE